MAPQNLPNGRLPPTKGVRVSDMIPEGKTASSFQYAYAWWMPRLLVQTKWRGSSKCSLFFKDTPSDALMAGPGPPSILGMNDLAITLLMFWRFLGPIPFVNLRPFTRARDGTPLASRSWAWPHRPRTLHRGLSSNALRFVNNK